MWRFYAIVAVFLLSFLIVIARLFYWQVVRAEELSLFGEAQYERTVEFSSQRGEIFASDGFPLVASTLSYLIYANPKEIKDIKNVSEKLSNILGTEPSSVSAMLSLDRFWVPVASYVSIEKKNKIKELSLQGVGFDDQFSRFYPEASMSAHLTGFVGKNDIGEDKGYFGLEGYYDRQLKGKTLKIVQIKDAYERPIIAKREVGVGNTKGRALVTSVDRAVQHLVEEKLHEGIQKYGASGGMIGVIDPTSGNIIAMASYPTFDQKTYQRYSEEFYKNPFISDTYEPGSTFKTLIMAAGLDAKVVLPTTRCPICEGPVNIGGYTIKTWNDKYYKNATMIEVLQHSDNTGMVFVGQSLGLEKLVSYLSLFGIGQATGIDLQGEAPSSIRPKEEWRKTDLATASFGQGISLTPIQLLSAFASIANKGVRMKPRIVSTIHTSGGEKIEIKPKVLSRPLSEKTAKIMTEMLVNAVNKGEAAYLKPKGYRVAGKTGTAQIPVEGKYDLEKTIASFIGFAPADDPKFAMLVIFNKPTSSIYGSETAAPTFFEIAKNLLAYYKIQPTE